LQGQETIDTERECESVSPLSAIVKRYRPKGILQLLRYDNPTSFQCWRCGQNKLSRLQAIVNLEQPRIICKACYGTLLSLPEIKAEDLEPWIKAEKIHDPTANPEVTLAISELRRMAYEASASSVTNEVGRKAVSTYYARSATVADYVKKRALGFCESCGNPAPFETKNGEPYLEPHHTIRRADRGPDSPDTMIAVCPNCHRSVHHGIEGDTLNSTLRDRAKFMEDQLDNQIFQNVGAAIIFDDTQRVLIAKRADKDEASSCWEFVGGKIRDQETLESCLKRELEEELTIKTNKIMPYYAVYHDHGDFAIRLFSALCKIESGTITLKEHSQFDWVDLRSIESYALCPADKLVAQKLRDFCRSS